MLRCPVCGQELWADERGAACPTGHRFDRAREGYLNLLRSNKSGDSMGDPKSQARSRRDFLNQDYYAPLRDALMDIVRERASVRSSQEPLTLLDICCGEGYYTSAMGSVEGVDAYGFDLGKEMVRLAAKRGGATYFVANMRAIPVADASIDVATHLFAPFNEREFARVLKPGGRIGISDVVAEDRLAAAERAQRGSYVGCIAGALSIGEYRDGLTAAGFVDVRVEGARVPLILGGLDGVDGAVEGGSAAVAGISSTMRRVQNGFVRSYALSLLCGAAVVLRALVVVNLG